MQRLAEVPNQALLLRLHRPLSLRGLRLPAGAIGRSRNVREAVQRSVCEARPPCVAVSRLLKEVPGTCQLAHLLRLRLWTACQ